MIKSALLTLSGFLLLTLSLHEGAFSQESIVVYKRNLENLFVKQSVENILSLSKANHGEYTIVPSQDLEHGKAFEALVAGDIDIMVSSVTEYREQSAGIVYLPLDRGLLGFRICLINANAKPLRSVKNRKQFISNKLKIGLGRNWPDYDVYIDNGFEVVATTQYNELFTLLTEKKFDCLSRSIIEAQQELESFGQFPLALDDNVMFVYPQADFIFVNPNKTELLKRLQLGADLAVSNDSYYLIFDEHYAQKMKDFRIFERHIIFMQNTAISDKALKSINRYAIASFLNHLQ